MKRLAIIGAGAAGLCAAIEARKENPCIQITVFEKMPKAAKKLLATGNGRCNFTNRELSEKHFHGNPRFISSVLSNDFSDIREFFSQLGVFDYEEEQRIYPRSQQASSIRDILLANIENPNTVIKTDCPVSTVNSSKNGFTVNGTFFDAVILCGGGKASSVHGSDGSCIQIAEELKHNSTALYPALCGLISNDRDLNLLKGVRAECAVELLYENRVLGTEYGEVQFTEKSVSGIPVMNLSHLCENRKNLRLRLDLCPEFTENELVVHFTDKVHNQPQVEFEVLLNGVVNLKLAYAIVRRAGIPPQTPGESLSKNQIAKAVRQIKAFELNIKSAKGFDTAQITKGGIKTDEVSPQTMESRKVSGLFLCGELLDIHGDCGGYNLHLAFTTGRIAGNSAGKYLK